MSDEYRRKLTPKQLLFVEEYLQCWNATTAARNAGYQGNDSTLGAVGYKVLRVAQVARRITERIQATCMSTDEALSILAQQARFDAGEYLKPDGEYLVVDLALMKEAGLTTMIKSLTRTKYGVKVEFYDAQAALEKILRAGGAYKDKGDGINVVLPVTLNVVYDDESNSAATPSIPGTS